MVSGSGTGRDGSPQPIGEEGGGPSATDVPRVRISSWSVVRGILLLAFGLVAVRVVTLASTPLWWLMTATVIAALFQPAIIYLRRWMPGWVAVLLLVAGLFVAFGLGGYRGLDEVNRQVSALRDNAVRAAGDAETSQQLGSLATEFGLRAKVENFFASLPPVLGGSDTSSAVQAAATGASALFAIGMLALLLLLFGRRFARSGLAQIDDPVVRRRVTGLVYRSYQRSAGYVWAMILRALVIAAVTYVAAAVAGFPAPTALAFWFGLWSVVPAVGLVVAVAPLGLGLAVVSPPLALLLAGSVMMFQVADAVLISRTIERRTVHLGPALTLVAALVGGSLYGVGGVLIFLALAVFAMAFLRESSSGVDDVPASLRAQFSPAAPLAPAGPEPAPAP